MFPGAILTICMHMVDKGLAASRQQANAWSNNDQLNDAYMHIQVSMS